MSEYLRGDEVLACVHRVALDRGAPSEVVATALTPELERRRRLAREHRAEVLEELRRLHPNALEARSAHATHELLHDGAELILRPRLADDIEGERRASVAALLRVGRRGDDFTYAPLLIKQHEVIEPAATRRVLEGSLEQLLPAEARFVDGVGVRSSPPMLRSGLALSHATRVLAALGHGDDRGRGAIIDRQRRLWWFDLAGTSYPRFNLVTYDRYFDERRDVLRAHDAWRRGEAPFPTEPYWHRDCDACPYGEFCHAHLEQRDDVSLVRFTSIEQQLLLREHGVTTRAALARLDPVRARAARHRALNLVEPARLEAVLGQRIDKLDDLIYRARAQQRGAFLRTVAVEQMGCATADVEVDVDMESVDDTTYLWGAYVSARADLAGVTPGYRAFVEWGDLTPASEAANFASFWTWLMSVRDATLAAGATFAAYCFWAQAEDGAMNRAVQGATSGVTIESLTAFRGRRPREWIDVHDEAKRQIQTEGPLGLKQLAGAAGFRWRDANPSGEASMLWYEAAVVNDGEEALRSRRRVLEYNEDDCRATKALRDWLNGPAAALAHRDDPL